MYLTLFIIHLLGLISPGPDFFFISRKAASSSLRNAVWASLGIAFGVGFWVILAVFGLAFLSNIAHFVQYAVMVLGGSFLAYLGFKMVKVKQNAKFDTSIHMENKTTAYQEIKSGLIINLSNPKVVVFFSSVLSGYATKISYGQDSFLILLMFILSTFIYFSLVAVLFSRPVIQKIYVQYSRYIDNFAGLVFIFFGVKLIYSGVSYLFQF